MIDLPAGDGGCADPPFARTSPRVLLVLLIFQITFQDIWLLRDPGGL